MKQVLRQLCFDDLLLVPKYSQLRSRSEAALDAKIGPYNFTLPIISSPMDTVTGAKMAAAMSIAGGLGIIHRGWSIASQCDAITEAVSIASKNQIQDPIIGAAIGVKREDIARAAECVNAGAKIICIDVSHGHHILMAEQLYEIQKALPEVTIIAGNVATRKGARFLSERNVAAIRVGIGNGSICSTRLNTGHGVPQATALKNATLLQPTPVISDGGCKTSGDILKAIALGAEMVMLGSMLAGTDEAPGHTVRVGGKPCKVYRGMASLNAQKDGFGKVYSVEGISSMVSAKGSVLSILDDIAENLRAGLAYTGANCLSDFRRKAELIQVSSASLRESDTHILERAVQV